MRQIILNMKLRYSIATVAVIIPMIMSAVTPNKISKEDVKADIDTLVALIEDVEVAPYAQLDKEVFYKEVEATKNSIMTDSITMGEFFMKLSRLTAMFKQGHLGLTPSYKQIMDKDDVVFPFGSIVRVEPETHKLYVTIDTIVDGITVKSGTEIIAINGKKSSALIDEYLKNISAESDGYACHTLSRYIDLTIWCNNPDVKDFDIELSTDGKTSNHKFKAVTVNNLIKPKQRKQKGYEYKMVNDSVMLFSFNTCQWNMDFSNFLREMIHNANEKGVKHMIIDVRSNGGGNSMAGDEVCRYITGEAFNGFGGMKAKISKRIADMYGEEMDFKYKKDTIFDETEMGELDMMLPYDAKYRFHGKTYLLTGTGTFSSASNFAWAYSKFVPGIVIGEETGGVNICVGDIISETLPKSGFKVILPWKIFYHYGCKDGDPIHGTIPDIKVPADAAFERALQLIETGA